MLHISVAVKVVPLPFLSKIQCLIPSLQALSFDLEKYQKSGFIWRKILVLRELCVFMII